MWLLLLEVSYFMQIGESIEEEEKLNNLSKAHDEA